MANYDNSMYTYAQVYSGTGYFKKDDANRYSAGVLELQQKLNKVGFWCGTPDGKFGLNTEEAVRHFQREYTGVVDGLAGSATLVQLELKCAISPGFTKTSGTYGVYFDSQNKKLLHNQQVVYQNLKNAGYSNRVIAGFLGNLEVESPFFRTTWSGTGGSVGIAQWLGDRKSKLISYINSILGDSESIHVQAQFIVQELKTGGNYALYNATTINNYLNNTTTISNAEKAADYVAALYEGCKHYDTWAEVQAEADDITRYTQYPANAYNNKYYIDIAKRRGYANAYYNCISNM